MPMAINKVVYDDETLIDLTSDTVTPESMLLGVTATSASGEKITGTLVPVTSINGQTGDVTIKYAGASSAGGAATSANKLNTDAGSATNPVYFSNGVPVKTTHTLGASVPSGAKFTDTTYGVVSTTADGLAPKRDGSTTKFLRGDGTWAVPPDTNTTYTFATGDANGQIKVTPSGGSAQNVSVKGLGTAAYTASTDYATAAQGTLATNALPKAGGTVTGDLLFDNSSSAQSGKPKLKWGTRGSSTPFIGFATDQTDGTFVVASLKGTNYASGLSIGGGSGNLLWKGVKVATTSDIPTYSLSSFGVTATAAELNYVDGVTSNIQTQLNNKSRKSATVSATLSASSWSSGSYTLSVSGVTTTSNQEILPATSITAAQLEALQAANIQDGGQSAGKIVLKAFGTVPTINIPIRVIVRGDA